MPDEVVAVGPALVDIILDTFRRVFPIYLWAVADEPEIMVERYLAAEFPGEEEDDDEPLPKPYHFTDFLRDTHLTPTACPLNPFLFCEIPADNLVRFFH